MPAVSPAVAIQLAFALTGFDDPRIKEPPKFVVCQSWFIVVVWLYNAAYNALNETNRRAIWLAYGLCPDCGYSLAGNISGVCPECGAAIAETVATLAASSISSDRR